MRFSVLPFVFSACAGLACAAGADLDNPWGGEVKNSLDHLAPEAQLVVRSDIVGLYAAADALAAPMAEVSASLTSASGTIGLDIRRSLELLAAELGSIAQNIPRLKNAEISVGSFPRAAFAARTVDGVQVGMDVVTRVDHLRGQIGFFPEPPTRQVEDLDGYSHPQFAISIRPGQKRIRVPVLFENRYIGDLIATLDDP